MRIPTTYIKTYNHYSHGMEKESGGEFIRTEDVENIINEFLGTLDKQILYFFLEELQK